MYIYSTLSIINFFFLRKKVLLCSITLGHGSVSVAQTDLELLTILLRQSPICYIAFITMLGFYSKLGLIEKDAVLTVVT